MNLKNDLKPKINIKFLSQTFESIKIKDQGYINNSINNAKAIIHNYDKIKDLKLHSDTDIFQLIKINAEKRERKKVTFFVNPCNELPKFKKRNGILKINDNDMNKLSRKSRDSNEKSKLKNSKLIKILYDGLTVQGEPNDFKVFMNELTKKRNSVFEKKEEILRRSISPQNLNKRLSRNINSSNSSNNLLLLKSLNKPVSINYPSKEPDKPQILRSDCKLTKSSSTIEILRNFDEYNKLLKQADDVCLLTSKIRTEIFGGQPNIFSNSEKKISKENLFLKESKKHYRTGIKHSKFYALKF